MIWFSFLAAAICYRERLHIGVAVIPMMLKGSARVACGWLIEACGLKGYARGRAAVYERQALVLVNRGGATGAELLQLAREVQERVRQKFGIALEPEPLIV